MENQNEPIQKEKSKTSQIVIIILTIIVVLLVGFIIFDNVANKNDNKTSNDPTTQKNYTKKDNQDKEEPKADEQKEVEQQEIEQQEIEQHEIEQRDEVQRKSSIEVETPSINLDEISKDLHSKVSIDSYVPYLVHCKSLEAQEGELPDSEYNYVEISADSIDTIINKLKTANKVDNEITFSWFGCPPKGITYNITTKNPTKETQYTNSIFSLNYAGSGYMLLVGYNGKGYAYYFDSEEDITNFIETLK